MKWLIGFLFSAVNYLKKNKFSSSCRSSFLKTKLRKLGKGVTIMNDVHFSGHKNIEVGSQVYIGKGSFLLAEMGGIKIGDNVLIAPGVKINSRNHNFSSRGSLIKEQGYSSAKIVIENDVWLAANCMILPGVTIGEGAVVAAGAVVSKDVKPYSVVAGVPARQISERS